MSNSIVPQLIEVCKENKNQIQNTISWLSEDNESEHCQFLSNIVKIIKIVSTEFSKDRFNKLELESSSKDACNKSNIFNDTSNSLISQLFKIRTEKDDEKKLCIFDVIFKTYLNYTNKGCNHSTLTSLIDLCKEIIKRLGESCWNPVQLNLDFHSKCNEIKSYYNDLDDSVLKVLEDNSSERDDEYLNQVYKKVQQIKKIADPYVNNSPDVDFSILVTNGSYQMINQIIELCHNCVAYFDNVIKTNERKNEKRRRVKRSQSGDLSSISPSKPILKDAIAGKENRSKISNFYESTRDIDNKGESRLKRQKSVTKKVPKTNTSKCSGGFLLKKISEKVKNPKQIQ